MNQLRPRQAIVGFFGSSNLLRLFIIVYRPAVEQMFPKRIFPRCRQKFAKSFLFVIMDNNTAERAIRNPVTVRKNYYGSGRTWSATLAALMFTKLQTILLWGINPRHWLHSFLSSCADNGGQAPLDLSPFLPWEMDEERKQKLSCPIRYIGWTHDQRKKKLLCFIFFVGDRGINPPVPPDRSSFPIESSLELRFPYAAFSPLVRCRLSLRQLLASFTSLRVFLSAKGPRNQGPRATDLERRKPTKSRRSAGQKLMRSADRQKRAPSSQLPPRTTRGAPLGSSTQAEPSAGAPS